VHETLECLPKEHASSMLVLVSHMGIKVINIVMLIDEWFVCEPLVNERACVPGNNL
jgi:hypothetical protein